MLWLLVLAVPLVLVVFDWWIDSELGSAEIDEQRRAARGDVGQVVETRDDALTITGPGPGQVVLTFDDGPDPRWTPQVLDVLAQHDVPATFFVVGKRVVDHPSLTRRIWDEGHELANHTFTHPDVASEHPWRQRFEVALTDRVIAGATGRQSTMYRLPFSSEAAQISPGELEVLHRFDDRLAVFSDGFTRDYLATDAADILDDVPALDASGGLVLLLHDGGGDRSATVAALDQLIPELRARGMEFVSLSEALGVDRDAVNPPAGRFERWSGTAVVELLQLELFKRPRRFGLLMLPYTFLSLVAMPLVLPIIDILAIVKIATNGVGAVVYLWLGLGALTFGSAWFAMRLNGESPKALVHLPLQQVVYRCGYVVLSLKALRMAVAGALLAWNKPPRRGEAGDALGTSTHLPDTDGHVVDEPAGSPVDIGVGVGTPEARTA